MIDGMWIVDEKGERIWMPYDELDADLIPKIFRPVGGFCYAADQFTRLNLPSVPFYIKDWLPKPGKALFYARGKVGKSFLALQLARCIGSGEDFIGLPTTQGQVLLLQFEIGASILQQRMRATGKKYPNVFVGTTFSMKLDKAFGMEQLTEAISVVQPNVVILDPFYKVLTGEENEAHDILVVFDNLDSIIQTYDCSVVIFDHAGKDLGKAARGSSIKEDYPDAFIELKGTDKGIKATPKLLRHAELPPKAIELTFENFEFRQVERELTVRDKVLAYLEEYDVAIVPDMEQAGIGKRRAVYLALSELISDGLVEKTDRGVYALTNQGYDVV